jgi:hypothetical protein
MHTRLLAIHLELTIIVITMDRQNQTEEEMIKAYHPDPNHRQLTIGLQPSTTMAYTQAGESYSWDSFLSFWNQQSESYRNLCLILVYDTKNLLYYGTTRID